MRVREEERRCPHRSRRQGKRLLCQRWVSRRRVRPSVCGERRTLVVLLLEAPLSSLCVCMVWRERCEMGCGGVDG